MIRRVWWAIKVWLFPSADKRKRDACVRLDRRRSKMAHAESMLDTAIFDLRAIVDRKRE